MSQDPGASPPAVRIRLAVPADAAALATFASDVFRDTYAKTAPPADLEAHILARFCPTVLAAEIEAARCRTVIADIGGEMVAYAQLRDGDAPSCVRARIAELSTAVEVKRFYVARAWHGRGIAQELMAACLDATPAGRPVWLGVFASNSRAIAFYAKCGFQVVGEMTFVMGQDHQRDYVMLRAETRPS
jgi:ribosomal protein S18 acetylase RimI-like enzyme